MKHKSRKKRRNKNGWLTTYSDLVTLLLAFFVLLFSFSEIDAKKWEEVVESLASTFTLELLNEGSSEENISVNSSFSISKSKDMINDSEKIEELNDILTTGNGERADNNSFDNLYENLEGFIEEVDAEIELLYEDGQIRLRLSNNLLFDKESDKIKEKSKEELKKIISIVKEHEKSLSLIITEGNTDNVPLTTSNFKGNFDLSIHRALTVLYLFKDVGNFSPKILRPVGYGEHNPIASNDTELGKEKNRRTDILLVKKDM